MNLALSTPLQPILWPRSAISMPATFDMSCGTQLVGTLAGDCDCSRTGGLLRHAPQGACYMVVYHKSMDLLVQLRAPPPP